MNRRTFLKRIGLGAAVPLMSRLAGGGSLHGASLPASPRAAAAAPSSAGGKGNRPNILFCVADDWGWPHAGAYGDPVVKTPAFDRTAREGVLFEHAYVSSPSCTPSRNAILTGQYHWRLKEGANLHSTLNAKIPVYPLLLERAGYHVGHWRKAWGPGDLAAGGYTGEHPAGKAYRKGFARFLAARPKEKPFCFWLGSPDPHRPYQKGSGRASGMDIDRVPVPGFLPGVEEVRSDLADYYFEVQRFDRDCAEAIALLERTGELDDTIVVMTGDNGIPFPRCKANIYDRGVREPLAVRWGARVPPGRRVSDFVSFTDFAPTFLEAAGVPPPKEMTGRSLLPVLISDAWGRVDPRRDHVLFGKERHTPAQEALSLAGYPCRGIRTDRFLYIRNFAPSRWPAGAPDGATHPMGSFADCDGGPTKRFLMEHRDDPKVRPFFDLAFAKRPVEELYDLSRDPDQLGNVAADPGYGPVREDLAARLAAALEATGDPRVTGGGEAFDRYPYRARYELREPSKEGEKPENRPGKDKPWD